jgi:hypothetical protein
MYIRGDHKKTMYPPIKDGELPIEKIEEIKTYLKKMNNSDSIYLNHKWITNPYKKLSLSQLAEKFGVEVKIIKRIWFN